MVMAFVFCILRYHSTVPIPLKVWASENFNFLNAFFSPSAQLGRLSGIQSMNVANPRHELIP